MVERAAELCERSGASHRGEAERLWQQVLDTVLAWQLSARRQQAGRKAAAEEVRLLGERLCLRLAARMREHVSAQATLRHVFDTHEATLSDVRELILGTLRASHDERTLLTTASAACMKDVYTLQRERHAAASAGKGTPPSSARPRQSGLQRAPPPTPTLLQHGAPNGAAAGARPRPRADAFARLRRIAQMERREEVVVRSGMHHLSDMLQLDTRLSPVGETLALPRAAPRAASAPQAHSKAPRAGAGGAGAAYGGSVLPGGLPPAELRAELPKLSPSWFG